MITIFAILAATHTSPLDLRQDPYCSDPDGCRSLWETARSCFFTILLCTWASVHPNVSSPNERWPRIALRRFGLMLATLILPEAIILWALRQRLAAAELAKKHEDKQWTITHGFFAIMGGFMEYDGNQPIRVLLPDQLQSYSLTGNGDFPRISKAEIEDKSKGDAIAKIFVVLHTTWFAIQCIARLLKGLPVIELELVTLAFAILNVVIYFLWWHKPLNVHRGVRVYKQRMAEDLIDDGDVEADVGYWDTLRDAFSELPTAIADGPMKREFPQVAWDGRVNNWIIYKCRQIVGVQVSDFNLKYKNSMRVTTFYPDKWGSHPGLPFLTALGMTTIATVFGGIHCIGWSFPFPSFVEGCFWFLTSASALLIPFMWLLFQLLTFSARKYPTLRLFFGGGTALLGYCYLLCRLMLLVLPFLCLRTRPPAVFYLVQWRSLLPHL